MINVNKLLESKRIEVKIADVKVDKYFVKQFRSNNKLTQIALANILGVTKKTVEKWEQGANNINGSSAVLLKLLNDNPNLIQQIYIVKTVKGKQKADEYETIESKIIKLNEKSKKTASVSKIPLVAMI